MVGQTERSTRWSTNSLPFTICSLYAILLCCSPDCSARDTITVNSLLSDRETLVSAGGRFELGFFNTNISDSRRYVGIYYRSDPQIIVWIANRNRPLLDYGGVLAIEDGNLKVLDQNGTPYWFTAVEASSFPNRVAKLLDSGNLVLSDDTRNLWESFKEPTDTFLPGMEMDKNLMLTSWTSEDDPHPGNYIFQIDQKHYLIKKNGYIRYWKDKESGEFFSGDEMPPMITYLLSNFSQSGKPINPNFRNNFTNMSTYSNTRLIMNWTGRIQYWSKVKGKGWLLIWQEPRDRCSIINFCGSFGSCNSKNMFECNCLPGFQPKSPQSWKSGDFSGGCTRKSDLCGRNDTYISLKRMKVEIEELLPTPLKDETECSKECTNNCQCQAYSCVEAEKNARRGDSPSAPQCWIWREDLKGLQEEYTNGSLDLYIKVAAADIESAGRNCDTCGINLIPYPLSTAPTCGDPIYFRFNCNTLNGELSFNAHSGIYRVTRINAETRTFNIQIKELDDCAARNLKPIDVSFPFSVTRWCNAVPINSSEDITYKGKYEAEINWALPYEPTCTSQRDCKDWPSSTCKLAENGERKCLCNEAFKWDGLHLNCSRENGNTEQESGGHSKQEGGFYVRKKQWKLIVGVTSASLIVLFCAITYFYFRRKMVKRQDDRESIGQNRAVRFYDSARHVKDLVDTDFTEDDKKGIDLPFFEFESILAATDNFSDANLLGKGGFGPVYKGKFPEGQEIAVKRLSRVSGQGLKEFKNEVVLIARLQHRNLVRLLGYCIEGGEQILLYEYMPNKSLDSFIFDPTPSVLLDWEMRFNIIMGIARGLLYLHQDSRLRIIHRDLKTSNVLLDQEMNPKISDFGLAKIFEGKQTEGSTTRVVGTYGYMSPEYALDGFFSDKSDVFSFGVVVLEIVSGKRNTGSYDPKEALSLLGYAWRLWKEDKALDIMDQKLSAGSKTNEVLKCINVGLLCVQEDPNDRPNMSNVIFMLGSETATLPIPKRPAFVSRGGASFGFSASSSTKPDSNTELTVSLVAR